MAEPKEQPKKIKLSVWLLEVYFNGIVQYIFQICQGNNALAYLVAFEKAVLVFQILLVSISSDLHNLRSGVPFVFVGAGKERLMHLSMLSRRGGRQGIGRGFDRHSWPVGRAFDRFSCPRGRII